MSNKLLNVGHDDFVHPPNNLVRLVIVFAYENRRSKRHFGVYSISEIKLCCQLNAKHRSLNTQTFIYKCKYRAAQLAPTQLTYESTIRLVVHSYCRFGIYIYTFHSGPAIIVDGVLVVVAVVKRILWPQNKTETVYYYY